MARAANYAVGKIIPEFNAPRLDKPLLRLLSSVFREKVVHVVLGYIAKAFLCLRPIAFRSCRGTNYPSPPSLRRLWVRLLICTTRNLPRTLNGNLLHCSITASLQTRKHIRVFTPNRLSSSGPRLEHMTLISYSPRHYMTVYPENL